MTVTTAAPDLAPVAPESPRSFDDHDEQFFLAEGSLAPTELVVSASDPRDEEPAPLSHAERLASPRRRVLARWVTGVVAAFAVFCVAAFATKSTPATAHAAASPPPAPLPVIAPVEKRVPVLPPAAPAAPPPAPGLAPEPARALEVREVARAALSHGALDESIARGFESVELDSSDAEAWLILGAAQMAKGQNAEARSTFTACTKIATHGPRGECFQMLQ